VIACLVAGGAFAQQRRPETEYDKVITSEAKTVSGLFLVHRIRERIYYEIPVGELNKDFLWVSQIARNTLNGGYGGEVASYHVVRWERTRNGCCCAAFPMTWWPMRNCRSRAPWKPLITA
jgi:hypothetical protein